MNVYERWGKFLHDVEKDKRHAVTGAYLKSWFLFICICALVIYVGSYGKQFSLFETVKTPPEQNITATEAPSQITEVVEIPVPTRTVTSSAAIPETTVASEGYTEADINAGLQTVQNYLIAIGDQDFAKAYALCDASRQRNFDYSSQPLADAAVGIQAIEDLKVRYQDTYQISGDSSEYLRYYVSLTEVRASGNVPGSWYVIVGRDGTTLGVHSLMKP